MTRRKVKLTQEESSSVSAASASVAPPVSEPFQEQEVTSSGTKRGKRLSVPLSEDGAIDLAACRQETLAKLRSLMADPQVMESLGLKAPIPEDIISLEDVSQLIDIIGGIEGIVFTWVGKMDPDIAQKHAIWNPQQKGLILKPAQAVIAKHAGSLGWYLRYRDEVALTLLFVAITRAKYAAAKGEMELRKQGLIPPMQPPAQAAPATPATPEKANGQEFLAPTETPAQ